LRLPPGPPLAGKDGAGATGARLGAGERSAASAQQAITPNASLNLQEVKAGLNFRFGAP
jgi:hypothetical protein